jgi:SAM-dependent methyltransferase
MKNFVDNWNLSYKKLDNFLLYPSEEVIRFFSNHIKRRTSLVNTNNVKKVLDLGCGSGRHLNYLLENGYYSIGLDISDISLKQAAKFLNIKKHKKNRYKLINSSSSVIPLKNNTLDYLIADGVIDSMITSDILKTNDEIFRVMKNGGLIYISLISNKIKRKGRFLNKFDQLITESHENKTV